MDHCYVIVGFVVFVCLCVCCVQVPSTTSIASIRAWVGQTLSKGPPRLHRPWPRAPFGHTLSKGTPSVGQTLSRGTPLLGQTLSRGTHSVQQTLSHPS